MGSYPIFLDRFPIRSNSPKVDIYPIRSNISKVDRYPIHIRSISSWFDFYILLSSIFTCLSFYIQQVLNIKLIYSRLWDQKMLFNVVLQLQLKYELKSLHFCSKPCFLRKFWKKWKFPWVLVKFMLQKMWKRSKTWIWIGEKKFAYPILSDPDF